MIEWTRSRSWLHFRPCTGGAVTRTAVATPLRASEISHHCKKLPKKETEKLQFPVIQNKVPMKPEEELKLLLAEEEGASETKRTLIIDTGRAKKQKPSQ